MPSISLDRWARRLVLPGLALVAVTVVAACGGSTPAASAAPPAAPKTSTPNRAPQAPPGTFGTAAAISGTSIEVQNPQNGQVTVNFSGSTTFTNTTTATLADVTFGSCVVVTATSGGNMPATLTARSVAVTPSSANGCNIGGAFGGGGNGGRPSGAPRPTNRPRPSGAPGPGAAGGRSFGSVSAVSATGFTVHNTNPRAGQSADTTVIVNSSTTYTKTAGATSSALAVGECVTAIGPADDTGAITARTIAISKPGPNGCTAGAGRFRGGFGGGNG